MGKSIDKKTVVNSFIWKTLERVFSQGINLFVQIVLARLLVPEEFGNLAIIVAITNYAAIFVQTGLATAIIQKKDLDDLDISTLLTMSLGIALVLYIGIFIAAPFIAKFYGTSHLCPALRVLSLILFLNAINSIQTAILSRKMQFNKIFFRSIIAVPVSGAVGILMAYMGFGIWALVAHNLVNMLATCIVMCIGTGVKFSLGFSLKRAKEIYSFSGKILVTSLLNGFYDTMRTMCIGRVYSKGDLAYYDKGNTYSYYAVQMVNASITSVLLPTFSREQDNMLKLKNMLRRSIKLTTFVLFPVLIGIAAMAKTLILLLLTSKWIGCVSFLMIFCILRIPGCIVSIEKQVFFALGKSGMTLLYETVISVLNIVLLIINLKIGVMAIAIGALIVEFTGFIVMGFMSRKFVAYKWSERISDLIKPTVNSVIMFLAVNCVRYLNFPDIITFALQIVVGVIVYILMSVITKDENLIYCKNLILSYIHKNKSVSVIK